MHSISIEISFVFPNQTTSCTNSHRFLSHMIQGGHVIAIIHFSYPMNQASPDTDITLFCHACLHGMAPHCVATQPTAPQNRLPHCVDVSLHLIFSSPNKKRRRPPRSRLGFLSGYAPNGTCFACWENLDFQYIFWHCLHQLFYVFVYKLR